MFWEGRLGVGRGVYWWNEFNLDQVHISMLSTPFLSWQFHEETTTARFRLQTCKSADKSLTQSTLVECTWPLTLPDTPSSLSEPSETLSEGGNYSRLHLFLHSFYYWCLKKLLFPQIIVLFFWIITTRRKLKSNWFVQMSNTQHHQESLHISVNSSPYSINHMTSNQTIFVQRIQMEWNIENSDSLQSLRQGMSRSISSPG